MTIEVAYLEGDGTGPEHSAHLMRQVHASLTTEGVGRTNGPNDFAVSQDSGSNMKVQIAKGCAMVQGDQVADQGLYGVTSSAVTTKDIDPSDPSDDRIDIVVLEVRDTLYGGAADDGRIRVVTGTPDPSPDPPATPDTCLLLAQVFVAAGSSAVHNADITDERVFMAGIGTGGKIQRATIVLGGSNFPVPNDVDTTVDWDGLIEDVGGWYDGGQPTRLSAPSDCVVLVGCQIQWNPDNGGDRRGVKITQGSGHLKRAHDQISEPDNTFSADQGPAQSAVTHPIQVTAGDYFEVRAFQNSGASLNIAADSGETFFWIVAIG